MWVAGTGYVQFDEFCAIVRKKVQDDEDERELREMFRILDKEKRGEVNTNELRYAHCNDKLIIHSGRSAIGFQPGVCDQKNAVVNGI